MSGLEVIDLHTENIEKFSNSMPNLGFIFVAFLAPWCSHCKQFKPEWEKTKKRLKNGAANKAKGHIITIDDTTMKNLPPDVKKPQGFPTLRLYKGKKHIGDYTGGRNMVEIIEFINSKMKSEQSGGRSARNRRHLGSAEKERKRRKTIKQRRKHRKHRKHRKTKRRTKRRPTRR